MGATYNFPEVRFVRILRLTIYQSHFFPNFCKILCYIFNYLFPRFLQEDHEFLLSALEYFWNVSNIFVNFYNFFLNFRQFPGYFRIPSVKFFEKMFPKFLKNFLHNFLKSTKLLWKVPWVISPESKFSW